MCLMCARVSKSCFVCNMRIVLLKSHFSPFKNPLFRFRRRRSGDVSNSESCRKWHCCDLHHSSAEHSHFCTRLTFASFEARVCIRITKHLKTLEHARTQVQRGAAVICMHFRASHFSSCCTVLLFSHLAFFTMYL